MYILCVIMSELKRYKSEHVLLVLLGALSDAEWSLEFVLVSIQFI